MNKSRIISGPPLIRLGHPMAFTALLRHVGAPVDTYLQEKKLPVLCGNADMLVPLARAWDFFSVAAWRQDAMLGWRVGAHVGDHNLNHDLLRKLETAPTLYQALQRLVHMSRSEASHIELGIYERRRDILLCTRYSGQSKIPGYRTAQAYQIGVMLDLIRHFLGRDWDPDEIGIEHTIDLTIAQKYFPGSQILSHQPMGYIAVPRSCLHRSISSNARVSDAACMPVQNIEYGFLDTLRMILRTYLPDGYPSAQFTANLMDVSERTLFRRLSANGLTYAGLIDELRFSEAKKLLLTPGMRIEEVAISVGFNDQSNFARMFRRIAGLSPKEFRKAALP